MTGRSIFGTDALIDAGAGLDDVPPNLPRSILILRSASALKDLGGDAGVVPIAAGRPLLRNH